MFVKINTMKERIDLKRARELSQILNGKKQPEDKHAKKLAAIRYQMNVDAGLESKSYLFFFEQKYYHVKDELKKIFEGDVKKVLDENPGTEIFFLCAKTLCPMPDALSGLKKTAKQVKDIDGVAQFISKTTGLTITKNDLQ